MWLRSSRFCPQPKPVPSTKPPATVDSSEGQPHVASVASTSTRAPTPEMVDFDIPPQGMDIPASPSISRAAASPSNPDATTNISIENGIATPSSNPEAADPANPSSELSLKTDNTGVESARYVADRFGAPVGNMVLNSMSSDEELEGRVTDSPCKALKRKCESVQDVQPVEDNPGNEAKRAKTAETTREDRVVQIAASKSHPKPKTKPMLARGGRRKQTVEAPAATDVAVENAPPAELRRGRSRKAVTPAGGGLAA
ncbi:hypothetical protein M422DRAFT_71413 [Sphaerobolus stellatus SS14]|uniref:Unplaced genomic scaffold SPHSTscaffold_229, whole genome shotgun sequence n=1 Tax=Sphaerobolus stellatus (strain SS14) TaxID=990650 RepID=A0A0C9U2W4_SPHS4|nr:hypothetical protein M422DRAFT_71413 [Sphaerobolus stellatus SS14]